MNPLGNDDTLARRALEHYPLECRTLAHLATSDSRVFRVEAEVGEAFVLRIHTSANLSAAMLEAEMAWLETLGKASGAGFQRPVRTREGAWVAPLAGTRAAAPWATLLSWVEGSALEGPLTLEQAERAGEVLAKLHLQAGALHPPETFERPTYDLAFFRRRWRDLRRVLGSDLAHLDAEVGGFVAYARIPGSPHARGLRRLRSDPR